MTRRLALLLVLLLCVVPPASAWWALGHRLVAQLAQDELTPSARREVDMLLKGEPEPTLAGVASWADDVRANDPVLGKRSAPWHYVGIQSPTCAYNAATDCPDGNCVTQAIRDQAAILADRRQPLEARRQALKFVVHFIGDAHQPLHANNREDKGGNVVQLRIPTREGGEKGSNLHSVWDGAMFELSGRDEAAYLARLRALPLAVEHPHNALPPDSAAWVQQSCAIAARPGLYPAGNRIDAAYLARWTPVADEQIRRAGARLAQVLNAALGR